MRIAFVIHEFAPDPLVGGTGRYAFALAQRLQAMGHEVLVFTRGETSPTVAVREESYAGLRIWRVSHPAPSALTDTLYVPAIEEAFDRWLDQHAVDLVHFQHTYHLGMSLPTRVKQRGIPVVLTLHDFWLACHRIFLNRSQQDGSLALCTLPVPSQACAACVADAYRLPDDLASLEPFVALQHGLGRSAIAAADLVLCASDYTRRAFETDMGWSGHYATVPFGIEPFPLLEGPRLKSALPTFGFMANIARIKGLEVLLEAFRSVADKARLIVFGEFKGGDVSYFQDLQKLAAGIPSITFFGRYAPDDLPRIFSLIDALVVPSMQESFGLVALEAMAAKVPVIASNVGGLPEIIQDGQNGLLFPRGDSAQLAHILQRLVDQPRQLEALKAGIHPVKTMAAHAAEIAMQYQCLTQQQDARHALLPAQRSPRVLALLYSLEPCPLIRLVFPLQEAERQGLLEIRFAHLYTDELTMDQLLREVAWADVVIFQRFGSPVHLTILEHCKALGKRVVFETDDDLLNLPPTNSNFPFFNRPDVRQTLETLIVEADRVTVSTARLQAEMAPLNPAVTLLPNVLPDPLFPEIADVPACQRGHRVVIGYAGTATHQADLEPILPALERLLVTYPDQVSLVFMGCLPSRFADHPSVTLVPETPDYESFIAALRQSGIHVGLAPLLDNALNRSKSAIKWMEYSACGIVSVCSKLGPYAEAIADGVDGILLDDLSPDTWFDALERLILEPERRTRLATQAYWTVRSQHMLSASAHRWARVYQELVGPAERLHGRRGRNLLTRATDPCYSEVLKAYLLAFAKDADVAMHVLAGTDLEKVQQITLEVLAKLGMDTEQIPDVSLLESPDRLDDLSVYLQEADLVIGADDLVEEAQRLGVNALASRDAEVWKAALASSWDSALATDPPDVSIVIPLYNKVEYTTKCLEALVEHTTGPRYEVILVDNASTDATPELLSQLEGDVRVIVNPQNLGFAKACNQGAAMARGRYVLFLNNDTEPQPGWLEPLIKTLDGDPAVGAVGARLLYPDGSLQHAGVTVTEDLQQGLPLNCLHRYHRLPADHPPANVRAEVQVVTGAALMIRRELFHEVGGFDEGYWNGNEDVDLCFTLGQQGWRIVYEPESCLVHHESVSGPERWRKVNENIQRLLQRWTGRIVPDELIAADGTRQSHPARQASRGDGLASAARVSIVLLGYNQLAFTKLCVESVLAHSDVPFELILVDNGSVDRTGEYFRELAARDSRVKAILNPRNEGFAVGCNQGIAAAQGDYVLFLNNDTIVPRNWLSRLIAHFQAKPTRGAVGAVSNCVSGPQQLDDVPVPNHPDAREAILAYGDEVAKAKRGEGFELPRLVGFCLMVRREALDQIGGFDPRYGIGNYEDDDLCLRILTAGFETWVAEDVYVHHFGSRTFAALGIRAFDATMDRGWELYKQKWDLPAHLDRANPYVVDLPAFDPARHVVSVSETLPAAQADPFRPGIAPLELPDRRGCAFFHHPDWSASSWQDVVTSYAAAFGPDEDVSLALWLDPSQGIGEEEAGLRVLEALMQAGIDAEQAPDILLIPDVLDLAGLARLYAATDCVVPAGDEMQASRATRLGLPVLDDLASHAWRAKQRELGAKESASGLNSGPGMPK